MPSPTHYLTRDAGIVRYSPLGRGVRDRGGRNHDRHRGGEDIGAPPDEEHVAAWLNAQYYRFKP